MARTSKTVIGGGEGAQGERMMRAAESGAQAREREHARLMEQEKGNLDRTLQMGAQAGSLAEEGERRQQQGEQFQQAQAQQESQFSRGLAQRQSETELEAAKAGFEPNSRKAKLQAEMDQGASQPKLGPLDPESQQRLRDQTQQPLEMDSSGRWRPTKERTANLEREQRRADFQADTERQRALAYQQQVAISAQKALAAGNMEEYETNAKLLANVPNGEQTRFDRLVKGEANDNDWDDLAAVAAGNPDPSIEADIKAKNFTPRVRQFVRAQVAISAMKSIINSEGSFDHLKVDWTNPKMVEFVNARNELNSFAATNPPFAEILKVKDTQDKMRKLSVMAALQVWNGLTQAPMGSTPGLPSTQAPSGGGGAAAPQEPMLPPGSTQVPGREAGAEAVRGARAGGASPSDALRAGQQANPTSQFDNDQAEQQRQNARRQLNSQIPGMR